LGEESKFVAKTYQNDTGDPTKWGHLAVAGAIHHPFGPFFLSAPSAWIGRMVQGTWNGPKGSPCQEIGQKHDVFYQTHLEMCQKMTWTFLVLVPFQRHPRPQN
jgi:hypothetical protein